MQRSKSLLLNLIFILQVLLLFLLFFEDRVDLPAWLQVAGRLHPVILHLPIGLIILFAILLVLRNDFKKKAFNKIIEIVLLTTSLTASVTALFGFFLSRQGDYGPDALTQHKLSGIALSIVCYLLVLIFVGSDKTKTVVTGFGILTLGLVFLTGHTGGTLTHGENYVLGPLKNSDHDMPENPTAFRKAVYPILEKKCFSCHNEAKAKGKFVMTALPEFKKGGKKGEEWVAGKPEESRMIKYIHLPLEDDDHMPPDGKPQLSKLEIDLLKMWIKSGADLEGKFADLKDNDSLKVMASTIMAVDAQPETKVYTFDGVADEVVNNLNTPFRAVFPLYQGSSALQADFFIKESFQVKALDDLKEVKDQLVVLNLSKMPVTDSDLGIIGNFKHLEKLNLNFSKVNGEGLQSLNALLELHSLSLAGTGVTAEHLKSVLGLPNLKELFVWNTRLTEEDKIILSRDYPQVLIATTQFADEHILRLSRPVLVSEAILKPTDVLTLKHAMPGVVIRYTLDGTKPDSVTSMRYEKPIRQATVFKIKAIACKPGWFCSDVLEQTCFVEGLKPERAELLTPPDKGYPGEGSKSLTDGRKGFVDVLREPSWLGFRDNAFAAEFDFANKPAEVRTIVLSYAENLGGYIFPPTEVEVWAGQNMQQLKLLKTIKPEVPKDYSPQRAEALTIVLESGASYPLYKIVAKPIEKLPAWHSGKGKKGWFFVDEVFFY